MANNNDDFDFEKVAGYTDSDIERIMNFPGMIKSERKIRALANNAQKFKNIREEFGSFDKYVWQKSGGQTIFYKSHASGVFPAKNDLSAEIAADLKKRGFKFVGAVNVYAFLQSCGIICDHFSGCGQYKKIRDNYPFVEI